jgi:rSAM/selenodomain-associated transferase 2
MPSVGVPRISIIIPALDEAELIAVTVGATLQLAGSPQVIVVDGGSRDATAALAAQAGAIVIRAPQGRGPQMHAGALAASGEVFWFLHADTLPPDDALQHMARALLDRRTVGGNFEIRFGGELMSARFLTRVYRHLARMGLRYGDSAYFVRRDAYFAAGGFRDYPIFEDLDLLARLQRLGRFVRVSGIVTSSSRRFEGRLFALVFLRWTAMQILYWLGVPPRSLGKLYRHVR